MNSGSVKKDYGSAITISNNTVTIGWTTITATPTSADAQYTYIFNGWTNTCGNSLTWNCTITANFERTVNKYLITFKNYNGAILQTWMVEYWTTPSYNGSTPTKPADAQYTYRFDKWSPAITSVTTWATYTATFTNTINQYTATIGVSPSGYGSVDSGSVKKDYGSTITISNNTVTIGWTTVTATPTSADAQYTYTFSGWTNTCGNSLTWNCTITAEFIRTVNNYDVTFDSNGWTPTPATQSVEYGSKAIKPADPIKTGYTFGWWTLNGNDFDFNTAITWTTNLVAKWNLVEYTIT